MKNAMNQIFLVLDAPGEHTKYEGSFDLSCFLSGYKVDVFILCWNLTRMLLIYIQFMLE